MSFEDWAERHPWMTFFLVVTALGTVGMFAGGDASKPPSPPPQPPPPTWAGVGGPPGADWVTAYVWNGRAWVLATDMPQGWTTDTAQLLPPAPPYRFVWLYSTIGATAGQWFPFTNY